MIGENLNPQEPEQTKGIEKVAGSASRPYVPFDKIKALQVLTEYPNNVTVVCRALGVSRDAFYWHIKHDPGFAQSVQEIREACCDELESTMYELGKTKSSFTFSDRIAFLRAHRPQFYDRVKVLRVEGVRMGDGERSNRLAGLEGAIDTEIVKSGLDRKAKRDYAKQKQIKAG